MVVARLPTPIVGGVLVVSLLQWHLACDIPMALAIKRIGYIICHLTLVMFYTTWLHKNRKFMLSSSE